MQGGRGRVRLKIGARPVALERVAPLRNRPLERCRPLQSGLRQVDLHAVARGLDVIGLDQSRQRRGPQPRERAAPGVKRQIVGAVEPTRRHDPAVLVCQVTPLRLGVGVLVPRMPPVDRVAEGIVRDEHLLVGPVLVVGGTEFDADTQVDCDQVGGHQLPVHDDARCDEHPPAPLGHVLVLEVAVRRVLERPPASEQGAPQTHLFITG